MSSKKNVGINKQLNRLNTNSPSRSLSSSSRTISGQKSSSNPTTSHVSRRAANKPNASEPVHDVDITNDHSLSNDESDSEIDDQELDLEDVWSHFQETDVSGSYKCIQCNQVNNRIFNLRLGLKMIIFLNLNK
jgi:hypothetical protein